MAARHFLGQRVQGVGVDGEGVDADRRHAHLQAEHLEHRFGRDESELDEHVAEPPAGLLLPQDGELELLLVNSPRSHSSAPSALGPSPGRTAAAISATSARGPRAFGTLNLRTSGDAERERPDHSSTGIPRDCEPHHLLEESRQSNR